MKNNNLITLLTITFSLLLFFSCKKEECAYSEGDSFSIPCEEVETLIENFDELPLSSMGNWQGINIFNNGVNSNNEMQTEDGPGGSYIYNTTDFPQDLVGTACELRYEVKYEDIADGNASNVKSIWIFDGSTPYTGSNFAAKFELNVSHQLINGAPFATIIVPLALGTTSPLSLPSNSYGEWKIVSPGGSSEHGSVPLTASLVTQFNNRISGTSGGSGVGFLLDLNGNPNPDERWWFDNFYISTCCPIE
jgi:hypothetical protein